MGSQNNRSDEYSCFESVQRIELDGGELSVDAIFRLLGSRRRRLALYYLLEVNKTVGQEELARRIATWETDADIDDVPSERVTQVMVALDHAHLPRLEDDGVVKYDRAESTVEATDSASQLEPFLELARDADFD